MVKVCLMKISPPAAPQLSRQEEGCIPQTDKSAKCLLNSDLGLYTAIVCDNKEAGLLQQFWDILMEQKAVKKKI